MTFIWILTWRTIYIITMIQLMWNSRHVYFRVANVRLLCILPHPFLFCCQVRLVFFIVSLSPLEYIIAWIMELKGIWFLFLSLFSWNIFWNVFYLCFDIWCWSICDIKLVDEEKVLVISFMHCTFKCRFCGKSCRLV